MPRPSEKVDDLLRKEEGVAIESIHSPRQRLEDLFIQIVEAARTEQASTSGAQQGGATASFLIQTGSEISDDSGTAVIAELQKCQVSRIRSMQNLHRFQKNQGK